MSSHANEVVSMDRPEVFFGMDEGEMEQVWHWLESRDPQTTVDALRDGGSRALYARGVALGLNTIGLGHSVLPGASVLRRPWVDALGVTWEWDAANLEPVSHCPEGSADTRDFSDLPDADFMDFARGLMDSVVACGWRLPQTD